MIHPQPGLASVPASLSLPHPAQGHLTSAASTDRVRGPVTVQKPCW